MNAPVERETMEVDVLFVGAGPATLASAYHLMQTCEARGIQPPSVLVIEKGAEVGDHMLSGAVVNPRAIQELMPDFVAQGFPTEYVCTKDMTYLFVGKAAIPLPVNPPFFKKKGYHVASLSNVAKWLAKKCEEKGVEIYSGFAGDQVLYDGQKVAGVRLGDMGVDKHGKPKANYQPGMDIRAKVTVLGEGVRGSLTKQLVERFDLEGDNPQVYETGIKEIWRIKPEKHMPGRVIHGMIPANLPQVLRRDVALRHEGQPRVVRHGVRARRHEPLPRPAPRGAEVQDASVDARAARWRRARPVRRQDDPDRRHDVDAEALRATARCWSATRPASATRRSSPASTWR